MAWNSVGDVSVTNGSATIIGNGTDWSKQEPGWWVWIEGETRPQEIKERVSATELVLVDPIERASASGLNFQIIPTQGLNVVLREKIEQLLTAVTSAQESWGTSVEAFAETLSRTPLTANDLWAEVESITFSDDGAGFLDIWCSLTLEAEAVSGGAEVCSFEVKHEYILPGLTAVVREFDNYKVPVGTQQTISFKYPFGLTTTRGAGTAQVKVYVKQLADLNAPNGFVKWRQISVTQGKR